MMPVPQIPGRLLESRIIGPEFATDHAKSRLEGLAIDPNAVDRTGCRTLPAGDLRTLEGWACRARSRHQSLAVAEYDFGVGADINQQCHGVVFPGRFGKQHGSCVGPDVACDAGEHVGPRPGCDTQVECRGR
jgi:hypothetical protein